MGPATCGSQNQTRVFIRLRYAFPSATVKSLLDSHVFLCRGFLLLHSLPRLLRPNLLTESRSQYLNEKLLQGQFLKLVAPSISARHKMPSLIRADDSGCHSWSQERVCEWRRRGFRSRPRGHVKTEPS